MTDPAESAPIVISLAIGDAGLAERVSALLGGVEGIRLAAAGEKSDLHLVGPDADERSYDLDHPLTPREIEVLALLAEGASNKVIARALGISVHTAKFHVASSSTNSTPRAARMQSHMQRG